MIDDAKDDKPIVGKAALAATAVGLWVMLVLVFAAPLALISTTSWRQTLRFAATFWALWLALAPAVAWLSFRFPIERKKLFRNVAVHVAACVLVVAANRASAGFVPGLVPQAPEAPGQRPPSRPAGPPPAFGVFLGMRAGLDALVYWSLVGACQAVINFQRSQQRDRRAAELEARLTSAKLQALRMQMNPHFLFNTLNSIAALVYSNPRAADEMLGDLSELLRRSLDSMENEVPLAKELEFVGAYLRIEQKRFGERLRLEQIVPVELLSAMVPALILQPLVENAIRHGIEPQRAPGSIWLEAKREGARLLLSVRDDGRGLENEERPGRVGIALANIKARLEALYGEGHSFSFAKAEPRGCRVEIRLPLRLTGAEGK